MLAYTWQLDDSMIVGQEKQNISLITSEGCKCAVILAGQTVGWRVFADKQRVNTIQTLSCEAFHSDVFFGALNVFVIAPKRR